MPPTERTIFRSDAPTVLVCWEKTKRANEQWYADVRAFCEKWDMDYSQGRTIVYPTYTVLIGFTPPHETRLQPPPQGWRYDQRKNEWLPALKTETGKEIKADLLALGKLFNIRHYLDGVGMPWIHHSEHYMRHPSVVEREGTTWVSWNCDIDIIDPRWTKVKLSEFYTMVEEGNDPFARVEDVTVDGDAD